MVDVEKESGGTDGPPVAETRYDACSFITADTKPDGGTS